VVNSEYFIGPARAARKAGVSRYLFA
jgi:hypothetical protein